MFLFKSIFTFLFCSVICYTSIAQNKGTAKQKAPISNKTKQSPGKDEIPPDMEQLENVRVPTLPIINFDTTSAPDDNFTRDIKELLSTMATLENELKAAEISLKQSLGSSMDENTTVFYNRFMEEMRKGRARDWLNHLYIRTYRALFTQSEVQELIRFYQTPIGRKLAVTTPMILQSVVPEAQKIGGYLGQFIVSEIMQKKNN